MATKKFEFKGFDWSEVAEAISGKKYTNDKAAKRVMRKYLTLAIVYYASNPKDQAQLPTAERIYQICKAYTKKIGNYNTYESSLWRGLWAIKDEYSFLTFFNHLYLSMWT